MFKKVHSMLQAVFRGRGLHMRMQGLASDYKMPKRGLLAHEVYGEVYKQCQTLFKRQAGEILPRELDPQDNTLAATYNRLVACSTAINTSVRKSVVAVLASLLELASLHSPPSPHGTSVNWR